MNVARRVWQVEKATRWSESQRQKVTVRRYSAYSGKSACFRPVSNHDALRFKGELMHTLKVIP